MFNASVPTPSNSPAPINRDTSTSGGELVVVGRFIAAGHRSQRPINRATTTESQRPMNRATTTEDS